MLIFNNRLSKNEYCDQKLIEWSMNIDQFSVGDVVIDTDLSECVVVSKTSNSIEVLVKKKNKNGIDSKNFYSMRDFNKRFKKR